MSSAPSRSARERPGVSWLIEVSGAVAVVLVFWVPSIQGADAAGGRILGASSAVLLAIAMLLRWKSPHAAVSAAVCLTALGWWASATTDPMVGVAWCLYPLAVVSTVRASILGTGAVGALVLVALGLGVSSPTQDAMQKVVFSVGALGGAWVLGRTEAERRAALRAAERRQAEFEQIQREAAMARDVHDVVGHALSTISAEAGVARTVSASDHGELLQALEDIELRSRSALEQVQSLVRSLRRRDGPPQADDEAGRAPTLRELATAATVSGLEVDTHIELPECDREISVVAARVVQEAFSNIIRHSSAERCELSVRPSAEGLLVRVDDDGKGVMTDGGTGSGISGMRERVEAVGGRLTVANRLSGGTRVVAELPLSVGSER